MVELDQFKYTLSTYEKPLQEVRDSLNLDAKIRRIDELDKTMEEPSFWEDAELSTKYVKEAKNLKDAVAEFNKLQNQYEEIGLMIEMGYEQGHMNFERHTLQQNLDKLKIYAYLHNGYSAIIDDIQSYYGENMRMLDSKVRNDLFYRAGKIYTKTKDSVPTIYREKSTVKNSLIADGCDINGTVENSILFRGVVVEEGAVIKNSIVMEHGIIQKDAQLSYTITDKNVVITESRRIAGYDTYPVVIAKNKTV